MSDARRDRAGRSPAIARAVRRSPSPRRRQGIERSASDSRQIIEGAVPSKADQPSAHPDRSGPRPPPFPAAAAARRPNCSPGDRGLVFLARTACGRPAARDAVSSGGRGPGCVSTRAQICDEGFALRSIPWRRRGDGLLRTARAIAAIARLYRAERPDILHHVALKPVLFGSLARHLPLRAPTTARHPSRPVMGLGSGFTATTAAARLRRPPLGLALRLAMGGGRDRVVVQNPEDRAPSWHSDRPRADRIDQGSGVDIHHFGPFRAGRGIVRWRSYRACCAARGAEAAAAIRRLRPAV